MSEGYALETAGERSDETALRSQMVSVARRLGDLGLNRGSTGNVSARNAGNWLVTPSGIPPEELSAQSMVAMDCSGQVIGSGKPSSEWRFHRDILVARPEVGAIVHTHSRFATAFACLHREIPAFHYMIAMAGGDSIRCSPYALFGTQELSDHALKALAGRKACLLGNHGMIALGAELTDALALAIEVESLCEQYWSALQLGAPIILSAPQMAEVIDKFKGYGRQGRA
jgi:L-fuculose-phosphate aldolase